MPTYLYECPKCGEFEAEHSVHSGPLKTCVCGEPVKKLLSPCQIFMPEMLSAMYDTEENRHRHYRVNKECAEGLANGTMMPNPERDVISKEQPRESVAQFNNMYNEAKGRTSSI